MLDLPLFYKNVVPLNRETHRDLRLNVEAGRYEFARSAHVIPAVIDEFPNASRHVPIVFLPGASQPTAVFLVGLSAGTNLMVDAEGRWTGGYVPAFVRRYPFILGEMGRSDALACLDDTYVGLSRTIGEPLFDAEGTETDLLRESVRLVNDYYDAAKRTDAFIATLVELKLLRGVTIEAKLSEAKSATVHGFMTVDEARLTDLSDADFRRLREQRLLAPIYAHLLSLAAVDRLQPAGASAAQPASPERQSSAEEVAPEMEDHAEP